MTDLDRGGVITECIEVFGRCGEDPGSVLVLWEVVREAKRARDDRSTG
jgi:hypothetical protein